MTTTTETKPVAKKPAASKATASKKAPAKKAPAKKPAVKVNVTSSKTAEKKSASTKAAPAENKLPAQIEEFILPVRQQLDGVVEFSKKQYGQISGLADEVNAYSKESAEVLAEVGEKAGEAIEALSTELREFSVARYEDGVAAAKAMTSAKSLKEAVDLQVDFAKNSIENLRAEGDKLRDMVPELARDVLEPVADQVSSGYEQFVKREAA